MTSSQLSPEEVLERCANFAEDFDGYEWVRSDEVWGLKVPHGFFGCEPRTLQVQPRKKKVVVAVQLAESVPNFFLGAALELYDASYGRVFLNENGILIWNETFASSMFASSESIEDVIGWAMRESFIAESVLRTSIEQDYVLDIERMLGFGFESPYDTRH